MAQANLVGRWGPNQGMAGLLWRKFPRQLQGVRAWEPQRFSAGVGSGG